MTYEELLAKVSPKIQRGDEYPSWDALKAVIEFHKPWTMQTGPEGDSEDVVGCECIPQLPAFLNPWPCPTIQIIERELS
jgi:hypothetical protein